MDRMERVNEQIKRAIGSIMQRELSDPRLTFVTITKVEVSRDLRSARVYFSVLGDAAAVEAGQKALNSAAGIVRRYVGEGIKMRYTPEFHFVYDRSTEFSTRVEQALTAVFGESAKDEPRSFPSESIKKVKKNERAA